MTKRNEYRKLCDEAMNVEFHGKSKAEMKGILDDLLGRALSTAARVGEPLSDWEKIHFADVISEVDCGLFWLARASFVKAVMPDAPKIVWPEPPNEDLDQITLQNLQAAEWLRLRPTQEHPIFMRR
jgi:hypothetical protein